MTVSLTPRVQDTLLAVEHVAGFFLLFVGTMGQARFYGQLKAPMPTWLVATALMVPFVVVLFSGLNAIAYQTRLRCHWFAGCWWAVFTLLAEASILLGSTAHFSAMTLCRAFMHSGWFFFVPLIHALALRSGNTDRNA